MVQAFSEETGGMTSIISMQGVYGGEESQTHDVFDSLISHTVSILTR